MLRSPPSPLLISPVGLTDLDPLVNVLARSFHPPIGIQALWFPFHKLSIRDDLRQRLANPEIHYCCLGAWIDGQLVGTLEISLRRLPNPFYRGWQPYISNLAVLGTCRKMGIGKNLLLGAEAVVKAWGYHVLHLHVMENNLPARHLYARLQYRLLTSQYDPFWLLGLGQRLLLYKPLSFAERKPS